MWAHTLFMSAETSRLIQVAEGISELLYTIAGTLLIALGGFGFVVTILRSANESVPSEPILSVIVLLFSVLLFALGVFVTPELRRRINHRESLTEFGKRRRVDSRVVNPEERTTIDCVVCGTNSGKGLLRRYRERVYIAGIPLFTLSEEHNSYCSECAAKEFTTAETKKPATEVERN